MAEWINVSYLGNCTLWNKIQKEIKGRKKREKMYILFFGFEKWKRTRGGGGETTDMEVKNGNIRIKMNSKSLHCSLNAAQQWSCLTPYLFIYIFTCSIVFVLPTNHLSFKQYAQQCLSPPSGVSAGAALFFSKQSRKKVCRVDESEKRNKLMLTCSNVDREWSLLMPAQTRPVLQ